MVGHVICTRQLGRRSVLDSGVVGLDHSVCSVQWSRRTVRYSQACNLYKTLDHVVCTRKWRRRSVRCSKARNLH